MSYTYNLATEIGKARFLVGDTFEQGHLLTDEEITYVLSLYTTELEKYNAIWNKYLDILSTRSDTSSGQEKIMWSQSYNNAKERYKSWYSTAIIKDLSDWSW